MTSACELVVVKVTAQASAEPMRFCIRVVFIGLSFLYLYASLPRSGAHRYTQLPQSPSFRQGFATRSTGSRQAILPDALRVNANLFQTDLCRNPGYMDVHSMPSMALDTRFPASMTNYLHILCIKRLALRRGNTKPRIRASREISV
jgi:hypothetical protein